jgi:acyl carrier protein
MTASAEPTVRAILAEVTGDPQAAEVPGDTALLREGLALSSLSATVLLAEIDARLGVDVAGQDLGLECLRTVDTLVAFVDAARGTTRLSSR